METEFDPGDEWRDILRLLYIINLVLFKIIHLIGKCLLTVAEFFINQTGSSSNDEPIKIAGEDTQFTVHLELSQPIAVPTLPRYIQLKWKTTTHITR